MASAAFFLSCSCRVTNTPVFGPRTILVDDKIDEELRRGRENESDVSHSATRGQTRHELMAEE